MPVTDGFSSRESSFPRTMTRSGFNFAFTLLLRSHRSCAAADGSCRSRSAAFVFGKDRSLAEIGDQVKACPEGYNILEKKQAQETHVP